MSSLKDSVELKPLKIDDDASNKPSSSDCDAAESMLTRNTNYSSRVSSILNVDRRALFSRTRGVSDFLQPSRLMEFLRRDTLSEGARRNDEIDKLLQSWQWERMRQRRFLILGPAGGGKATLLRQLRILFGDPFTEDERRQWRWVIFRNMATAACGVLDYMYKQRIEFENGDSKVNAECVKAHSCSCNQDIVPASVIEAIQHLWIDEDYQSALSQMRDKYKYTMCNIRDFDHFMNNFDRLSAQDYVPINEDILRTDKPLIGMTEAFFNVSGCEATFYDLGGCRGERRKWIHAFDDCNGVIFPVAMNKFDEYPINDQSAGSLQEALVLFESVINSRWFARCAIVLFFTKVDLFKEKIMSGQSKISENFPDYNGQPTDTQVAQVFFMDKFTKLAEAANAKKILYVHFINLLDCRMTKFAVSGIMDALFSCRFMIYP